MNRGKMRILAIVVLAAVALPLLAMPTRQELKLAEGTVREMMLPEFNALKAGEKSRADVAKAAVARAKMAESEAEKMLLLKGAFVLYVRHGAFDEAVEALMMIHTQIPDVPPQIVSNIVESASRTMSKGRRDSLVGLVERMFLKAQTVAMYRSANGRVQLWEGGPYWAEKNIGAENPWDYGYYFWWGDTIGYKRENGAWVASDGSSSNFSFDMANTPTYGKSHQSLRDEGWITADGKLAPEHDAAHVQLGDGWRMPTKHELAELGGKCYWAWTTLNGVHGYVVTGRGPYASASIFLPAGGYGDGTLLNDDGSNGNYWSSIRGSGSGNAWYRGFRSSNRFTNSSHRSYGRSIRPVHP